MDHAFRKRKSTRLEARQKDCAARTYCTSIQDHRDREEEEGEGSTFLEVPEHSRGSHCCLYYVDLSIGTHSKSEMLASLLLDWHSIIDMQLESTIYLVRRLDSIQMAQDPADSHKDIKNKCG